MQIAERKLLELREKLAGITVEFDWWLADTGDKQPLRKHQSQITRLTDQLRGLADRVGSEIDRVSQDSDDVLEACRALQMRILEVHRLWDYYRSKLNLRYVAWFRPYLVTVDEFAWACYKPALDHDRRRDVPSTGAKEAPLVFLSGEFSPFTHLRQKPFDVEEVEEALDSLEFLQVIFALPVPVIGLPWYQVAHLPDAVVVAHEVGHDVERDLGLTDTMQAHLRAVSATMPGLRRSGWFAWLPEVFADLYGVLAAGPAFVSALIDLLATDPVQIVAESAAGPPWTKHPPASLRVAVTTQALEQIGFERAAADRRCAWAEAFALGPNGTDPVGPFRDDVEAVVHGLLIGRYPQFGKLPLREVVSFSADQQWAAEAGAEAVLQGLEPASGDIRCLVAAARLAFESNPARYQLVEPGKKTSQQLILDRADDVIGDDPRADDQQQPPEPAEDRAAGAALFDLITKLKRGRGETDPGGPRPDTPA
jgi:hypothetical protein